MLVGSGRGGHLRQHYECLTYFRKPCVFNIFSETLYEVCLYYCVQTWYSTVHFVCTGIYFLQVVNLSNMPISFQPETEFPQIFSTLLMSSVLPTSRYWITSQTFVGGSLY
jgi:hypothetical protein